MFTTPVVNRHAPPTHRRFSFAFFGKGQRYIRFAQYKLTYLRCTHESGRAVAPLDSRGVGHVVAQSVQCLLNALFAAMDIPDFNFFETVAALVLDDLHMSRRPWDAETGLRLWPTRALPGRVVRRAEYLREQGTISRYYRLRQTSSFMGW
jgi:hypothetical protein